MSSFPVGKTVIQVVHCTSCNHWIAITNLKFNEQITPATDPFNIKVYDSAYISVNENTVVLLKKWFGTSVNITMPFTQMKVGPTDCGLFSFAILVALLCNIDPFDQPLMRKHLVECFKNKMFTMFP